MKKVFISYRRADAQMVAGRLYDSLVRRFGPAVVFRDKEAIRPGYDWVEEIQGALQADVVVLALIGPQWAESKDARGRRRLDDSQDPNRLELETALAKGTPLIPVLVEGAVIPEADALPASLAALTRRNAIRLRDDDWAADFSRIAEALESLGIVTPKPVTVGLDTKAASRRRVVLAGTGLLGGGALVVATWPILTRVASDVPEHDGSTTTTAPSSDAAEGTATREKPAEQVGAAAATPANMQRFWRRCAKCKVLWYYGDKNTGKCAAGGEHELEDPEYYVNQRVVPDGAQGDWRWCSKCQGLWHISSERQGKCPAGGGHAGLSTTNYSIFTSAEGRPQAEELWRYCTKCGGLWFDGDRTRGVCSAGGFHSNEGSGNYALLRVL